MRAFITGVTGQDGAYLSSFLLHQGYQVIGGFRRRGGDNLERLRALGVLENPNFTLVEHDLTDLSSSLRVLGEHSPDEVYNLAAQSFVGVSFDQPITTSKITGEGALNMLEAVRIAKPDSKFYQASTSEMFGKVQQVPQSEETDFYPRSPYGVAKLFAHWSTINYRESYNMFATSGILFNHESPLRGPEFVTRKITLGLSKLAKGSGQPLKLGNLDAKRDWGFAGDFVEGMWKMMQATEPDTFVLATGVTTEVREFLRLAAEFAGFDPVFEGSGVQEKLYDRKSNRLLAEVSEQFFRPAEVDLLIGDASKAKSELDWEPKVQIAELCEMMVKSDLDSIA